MQYIIQKLNVYRRDTTTSQYMHYSSENTRNVDFRCSTPTDIHIRKNKVIMTCDMGKTYRSAEKVMKSKSRGY